MLRGIFSSYNSGILSDQHFIETDDAFFLNCGMKDGLIDGLMDRLIELILCS